MKRKQLSDIEQWMRKPHRKPLIVRGARQVGKSTLIKLFAESNNIPYSEINLERYPDLASSFDSNNPKQIIDMLEALPNVNHVDLDGILFLDEIQAIPEAIPTLRYFYEEYPQLAVITAGSLLEFTLSNHSYSMPVGRVEYMSMGPMTFLEFLDAIGEEKLLSILNSFEINEDIPEIIHNRLLRLLRTYFYVGGMPEAVKVYKMTESLKDVSDIHQSIIETYRDDFPKYIGNRDVSRIQHVFNYAARNIGKKVKYVNFTPTGGHADQSRTIKKDIELLCMARVLSKVVHSHCSGLPLQADMDEKSFKLLFLDVGLMNAICGMTYQNIQNDDLLLINEGAIAEQFVGQHLQDMVSNTINKTLNYWLREGKSNNAEVDFVVAANGKILPIEVKSGSSGSLRSLHQFMGEKNSDIALRLDACPPSTQTVNTTIKTRNGNKDVSYKLASLPLYLVERIPELLM